MNESHVSGAFDQAKGKLKEGFGEATGDEKLANSGAVDQVTGQVKQGWGDVKDAFHNATHSETAETARTETHEAAVETEHTADHARSSFVEGVEELKDNISRGLHNLTHHDKE